MLAAALLGWVRASQAVGGLGEREQVLVAACLTGLRSAQTRRTYAGDLTVCLGWLADRDTDVLADVRPRWRGTISYPETVDAYVAADV